MELRKSVYSNLNKNLVLKELPYSLKKSTFLSDFKKQENKYINDTIRISYDAYYPNKKIVKLLSKQLKTVGINVNLVKTEFTATFKENSDFKLYLVPELFGDISFTYFFIGVFLRELFSKEDFVRYMNFLKRYWESPCNGSEILDEIKEILKCNYILFSIGEMNNVFLCRSDTKIYGSVK